MTQPRVRAEVARISPSDGARPSLRDMVQLQERAHALESEIQQRKELEMALREALAERRRVEEELRASRREAESAAVTMATLNRMSALLNGAELDLEKLVQTLTDEATLLVSAQFGAFLCTQATDCSEAFFLCSLSGASKEAFSEFDHPRNALLLEPTFAGRGIVRSDDIPEDPRYGKTAPHLGTLPGGVPLVSYLAVSVVSRSGKVLGGLFFGHPERARFTQVHERLLTGVAVHAAIAIENAQIHAERVRLVRELTETVRLNELFAGVLAHDLRNPLSAIATGAQLALMRGDSEQVSRPLRRVLSSTQRMTRMIEQLLDFTRARVGGGIELQPKHADLLDLCQQVINELEDANPGWRMRLEATGNLAGIWDPDRLLQVFSNLVANAVQHGQVAGGVHVRLDGIEPEAVVARVHNRGAIPSNMLADLFDPFRRTQQQRSGGTRGLGLGLFITKQVVLAHGGTIDVESDEENGTTLILRLPRRTAAPAGAKVVG